MTGDQHANTELTVTSFHPSPIGGGILIGNDERRVSRRVRIAVDVATRQPKAGEAWRVSGPLMVDEVCGEQIHADVALPLIPRGQGIVRWIATNKAIVGVGTATATKLWDQFGADLYDHLRDGNVAALAAVIGPIGAQSLVAEFRLLADEVSVLEHFDCYGIDAATSIAACRLWGAGAIQKLSDNPYSLILLQPWRIVDERGLRLGLAVDDNRRLIAAISEVMARRYRGSERLSGGHTAAAKADIIKGARTLLGRGGGGLAESAFRLAVETGELIAHGDLYQGRGPAMMEREIERRVAARSGPSSISNHHIDSGIAQTERDLGFSLDKSQASAVRLATSHRFAIVDGPAGTGKSTVTRAIMIAVLNADRTYHQIALSGRAAKRLKEATGHEAMTVHRFLKALTNGALKLGGATLVIDEASMISTPDLWQILIWVPEDTDIILVGDPGQLPPIAAGNPLSAMVQSSPAPRATLTQIHRQEGESPIPFVAAAVRSGSMPAVPAFDPKNAEREGVYLLECTTDEVQRNVLAAFEALVGEPAAAADRNAVKRLHSARAQILGMTIRGPAGVREISEAVERRWFCSQPQIPLWGFAEGSKILWTRNSYGHDAGADDETGSPRKVDIMNGSLGIIQGASADGAWTLFDDDAVGTAEIRLPDLMRVLRGWAITVHKAQGSSFERVIVPITPARLLDRHMLYTAITRARRTVILVGDPAVLRNAVRARGNAPSRTQCLFAQVG